VVALDQRGYGQSDCPEDIDAYDITHLVGDVVGLIKALDSDSAVLVGQDWGSPVAYNTALMRVAPSRNDVCGFYADAADAVFKALGVT
jgi:pimeloyl-ACP methyl ester carboxylesterase